MNAHDIPAEWPPQWPNIIAPAVRAALAAVPRHLFVPERFRYEAYRDIPLPIGHEQTISQPYIVALMTQALALTPDSRVLEIGTGSGYQAAILAQITPHVWSVETRSELAATAAERLRELGYPVQVKQADGRLGWPEHAPFDAIIVTAAAPVVPAALVAQLTEDGRLVIPVGESTWDQVLWLIEKHGGRLSATRLADVRFVPLVATADTSPPDDPALETIQRELARIMR